MMDYASLDAVAKMIDAEEDPRVLRLIFSEANRLGSLASAKSVRLALIKQQCYACFKPLNEKGRCSDNTCPGWLP
jgi:hypothetical protein